MAFFSCRRHICGGTMLQQCNVVNLTIPVNYCLGNFVTRNISSANNFGVGFLFSHTLLFALSIPTTWRRQRNRCRSYWTNWDAGFHSVFYRRQFWLAAVGGTALVTLFMSWFQPAVWIASSIDSLTTATMKVLSPAANCWWAKAPDWSCPSAEIFAATTDNARCPWFSTFTATRKVISGWVRSIRFCRNSWNRTAASSTFSRWWRRTRSAKSAALRTRYHASWSHLIMWISQRRSVWRLYKVS